MVECLRTSTFQERDDSAPRLLVIVHAFHLAASVRRLVEAQLQLVSGLLLREFIRNSRNIDLRFRNVHMNLGKHLRVASKKMPVPDRVAEAFLTVSPGIWCLWVAGQVARWPPRSCPPAARRASPSLSHSVQLKRNFRSRPSGRPRKILCVLSKDTLLSFFMFFNFVFILFMYVGEVCSCAGHLGEGQWIACGNCVFFQHVGPQDGTQISRLNKGLYLLSHLTGPIFFDFKGPNFSIFLGISKLQ